MLIFACHTSYCSIGNSKLVVITNSAYSVPAAVSQCVFGRNCDTVRMISALHDNIIEYMTDLIVDKVTLIWLTEN